MGGEAAGVRAPRVTVGVPTYNRSAHVGHAVGQKLAQDFDDFELIVSDDASTDSTTETVQAFRDPRLIYHRNAANLKIPGNLNQIMSLARGEYLIFLHDHDSFDPTLLSRMVRILDENPAVGMVFSGLGWTDYEGNNYRAILEDLPERIEHPDLARRMLENPDFSCPVNACGMVRRSAYEAVGYRFDDRFGFVSDVDMWYRIGLRFDVSYIREALITCRGREPGHEFGSLNWRLVRWTIEIQLANLERYCEQVPDQRAVLSTILRSKTNTLLLASQVRTLVSNQRSDWDVGIRCLREFGTGSARVVGRLLALIPGVVVSQLVSIGQVINSWRKRSSPLANSS